MRMILGRDRERLWRGNRYRAKEQSRYLLILGVLTGVLSTLQLLTVTGVRVYRKK